MTSKAIRKDLRKDNLLMAELGLAKELGMTLGQLRREITYEELYLWLAYFGILNEDQEDRMKKAQRRR